MMVAWIKVEADGWWNIVDFQGYKLKTNQWDFQQVGFGMWEGLGLSH